MAKRSGPSARYRQRAEQFCQAVDIAIEVVAGLPDADRQIRWGLEYKDLALGVHPLSVTSSTLAGLRSLEDAFFTSWHESTGAHVDQFWQRVAERGLPYERKDILGAVLARGHIRTVSEYEVAVDSVVIARQQGRITAEQAALLAAMIGRYEQRRSRQ